ncbi:50S ribosomal protein L17 [Candidatus Karelsulcia muelleri]
MRHQKTTKKLCINKSHRKALLTNLALSLIQHKRITTTFSKAKALKQFIEPIITIGKTKDTHSIRLVFNQLNDKAAVWALLNKISTNNLTRHGGYTRIIKLGHRLGDGSERALIELV